MLKPFSPARLGDDRARASRSGIADTPADLDGLLALAGDSAIQAPRLPALGHGLAGHRTCASITVEEICYFQRRQQVHARSSTADGESLIRKTIAELAAELDPDLFWQIHRSTIVNVNEIAAVHRKGNGTLELRLKRHKQLLAVSSTYVHLFRQM